MKKLHNPHDKYFRFAMSDVRVATEFFEEYTHLLQDAMHGLEVDSSRWGCLRGQPRLSP